MKQKRNKAIFLIEHAIIELQKVHNALENNSKIIDIYIKPNETIETAISRLLYDDFDDCIAILSSISTIDFAGDNTESLIIDLCDQIGYTKQEKRNSICALLGLNKFATNDEINEMIDLLK